MNNIEQLQVHCPKYSINLKTMKNILRLGYVRAVYPWITTCGIEDPNSCRYPGVHLEVLRLLAHMNNLTIYLVKAESYGRCNVTTGICTGLGTVKFRIFAPSGISPLEYKAAQSFATFCIWRHFVKKNSQTLKNRTKHGLYRVSQNYPLAFYNRFLFHSQEG